MTAIFFFAHQDDEYAVYQQIAAHREAGGSVICAYLTTGVRGEESCSRRNAESLAALSRLGITERSVLFAGSELGVEDLSLHKNIQKVADWISNKLSDLPNIQRIYIPAWEGGHPDHDCLHAAAVSVAAALGLVDIVRQFPLYNGYKCPGLLFRFMHPLSDNGPVEKSRISLRNRMLFLRLCLSYPSQTRTWLRFFPCAVFQYLIIGEQYLQGVSMARIRERPHAGLLYSEKRNFNSWADMELALRQL
ncbi:MAG: PIG-L family deacetylase [Desulfovibrio sp.]|jgi:LmbE family N-acetylglucosaminyl deacetylase|nr:PIG-L family deacetylase [Desulfovibrio sp.]